MSNPPYSSKQMIENYAMALREALQKATDVQTLYLQKFAVRTDLYPDPLTQFAEEMKRLAAIRFAWEQVIEATKERLLDGLLVAEEAPE